MKGMIPRSLPCYSPHFVARKSARGVRITAIEKGAYPKSRVISMATWKQLQYMTCAEYDGSIVLELGIGTFQKT